MPTLLVLQIGILECRFGGVFAQAEILKRTTKAVTVFLARENRIASYVWATVAQVICQTRRGHELSKR